MKLSRRDFLILGGSAVAALALPLPASAAAPQVLRGAAFGTTWTFASAVSGDPQAIRAAFAEIVASVDSTMSPFRFDSEITVFNRASDTGWHDLSSATCAVVAEGLRVAQLTANAFNPTLGPVVGRYGFGPIHDGSPGLPDEISVRDGAVRKVRGDLSLDLCGIAKGHALDRMAHAARTAGAQDFLIELGGEVFAQGLHPAGRRWQVAIEAPASTGAAVQRVVGLGGVSLATSGSGVNGYAHGDRQYAHIIDPTTREPANSRLFSVTVAATTAMTADALATALYAMGPDDGPAFARQQGIEALFVMDDGRDDATGGFDVRILG